MKKLLAIIILSASGLTLSAQSSPVAVNTPSVEKGIAKGELADDVLTLNEMDYDFGKIPQGKPVTHVFEVWNKGSDSLRISNVQASCGCTTPEWARDKVQAPGEQTKIVVGYNAASEGPFNKQITITYNGSLTKQITIKGEVWKSPVTSAPENNQLKELKNK
jgi:hypothetical protein